MRTLLLTALLIALPGAPRAEAGTPPAPAEKPAQPEKAEKAEKARRAKGSGAKAQPKADGAKTDAKEKDGAKGAAAPAPKPCEPVKPCPID